MLSYRHGFHAGNAADVFKHSVLFSFLKLYTQKAKPFTAFDLNGGSGVYNLLSEWSVQTGEADLGIVRLLKLYNEKKLPYPIPEDFKNYLEFCKTNYKKDNSYYGSPEIIRSFLPPESNLIVTDLHSAEAENLKLRYKNVQNIHVHKRDCYEAVCALTPPNPVRGFALFDPSYEIISDYKNVAKAVEKAKGKWNAGIFIVWYPLLEHRLTEIRELKQRLSGLKNSPYLNFEVEHGLYLKDFYLSEKTEGYGLRGSGIFIINPIWGLKEKLEELVEYVSGGNGLNPALL
ncbi:23S rRNA (adenine(2030)-N(6))-methyltransferase RlmJ [Treponema pedis]|uniref:Ribosomal RNA large subunit methyltransferase J n=1 Tax=Treponema pedis str. T A4 TaxID=1291379 RepID=S6A826_9SPIR|nr:23S rRNA (adenine(2030)-N(6))-methyltransferase RlmJ [Treponema pedis]AGT43094.1 hypothetical protein TPE_0598 [Treponema pedis str. T A4]